MASQVQTPLVQTPEAQREESRHGICASAAMQYPLPSVKPEQQSVATTS
jgi:hypothetical protein